MSSEERMRCEDNENVIKDDSEASAYEMRSMEAPKERSARASD